MEATFCTLGVTTVEIMPVVTTYTEHITSELHILGPSNGSHILYTDVYSEHHSIWTINVSPTCQHIFL